MSRRILLKQGRLERRKREIAEHFHVKRQFCECCRNYFYGEIEEHLRNDHDLLCDRCADFDTDRCYYRKEVASVWKII